MTQNPIADLLDEWRAARAELVALEASEHPDIVDALGRAWTWLGGDLYRHDGMAWTVDMIRRQDVGLPSDSVMSNPNYTWCEACRAGR